MRIGLLTAASAVIGLVVFGALVFVPAGTFDYWQGWAFMVVFAVTTLIPSRYLAVHDPDALRRRMRAGPAAETRPLQKIASTLAFTFLAAMIIVSVLDHRFGWSVVPAWLSVLGNALVAAGLGIAMLVVSQNSYAAANVIVESGQAVVTTGLYRLVRHPMYAGNVIMMVGIPPALGSYWGLLFMIPGMAILAMRIVDEEQLLRTELDGYDEYTHEVRYRLLPHVW
ncbi:MULTISPECIES: isoprenylcysteine carboxylmethyltransferase family protein [unclassified Mycolicibacterium]|uniref:methyltransferase family protein n=1 Tax=unclassified Mycolicibacterium TaxID=2636767 RepID=UPI0013064C44|nr:MULTISPECIES: isoprenylcysteine carboxylmethyltransferase family protein [unclassified Mycolicibacterium]MUL84962.1 isoprenylcysteine carboxylmethyltransferase family protein [Mycolicibacterium sp. CBMA 329]MUL90929.1 isoprenylcysteine carboxylmethyltransferase family protein [Mycolicibacterium sp. CBMA 331]MUL98400.1 isoprenylcysteine carboxylmethyltransferase family protein [Mycolicibacterium sp. CBMA 334]MUM28548.1 isoprenylcysteine carboxylmethyltransferase family protein [Mycolicibacter